MKEIKLIALDLDYTLLNQDKQVSERNMRALKEAADRGIHIVPATGRFYDGMPQCIKDLDFIRYMISINGSCVLDVKEKKVIYKAEIANSTAVELISFTKDYPVAYDCYMGNVSYMNKNFIDEAEKYAPDRYYLDMFKNLRVPVEDLGEFIKESGKGVQKIQWFMTDLKYKSEYMDILSKKFPELMISSSVIKNIEINDKNANKGQGLYMLARHLGIPIDQTLAFGDNSNDLTMIQRAGIGAAMGNATEEIKNAADYITLPYDEDGVAYGIKQFCGIENI